MMHLPGVSSGNTILDSQEGDETPTPPVLWLVLGTDALLVPKDTSHRRQGDEG